MPYGKTSVRNERTAHRVVMRPVAWCVMLACCELALANPTGPQVAAGTASFATAGKTLTVTNAPGTIINWNAFSIGRGETTRFVQQSAASAVLNRVVGRDLSSIFGTLSSNGRVFLINPNGIVFGAGAVIDTAGFVASTLNMSDQDFLNGKRRFDGGGYGVLRNEGTIRASGDIVLVGPAIQNAGIIRSENGSVLLAAGKALTITSPDAHGITFTVQAPTDSVVNIGSIAAANAAGMFAGTLRHSGDIDVTSARVDASGRIVLTAQNDVVVESGAKLTADNSVGAGGTVHILGDRVSVLGGAVVSASGASGGGTVLIGGDYRGENPKVKNASTTLLASGASVRADALKSGDGGRVIVWANDIARVHGAITAFGAGVGRGGFVETSSHNLLDVQRAPQLGAGGTWLLDPRNLFVETSTTTATSGILPGTVVYVPGPDDSVVKNTDISGALNSGTSVYLNTGNTGSQAGNITVNAIINKTTANSASLSLTAENSITINQPVDLSVGGSVTFNTNTTTGAVTVNREVRSGSGMFFALNGGLVINANAGASGLFNTGNSQTISARSITINGNGTIGAGINNSGAGDQNITAGVGGITLTSTSSSSIIQQQSTAGNQTLTVNGGGGITLTGGTSANASALIQNAGPTQTITVNNGGTVTLTGGSAQNATAAIENTGAQQLIDFTAGGTLNLVGGSGSNDSNSLIDNIGAGATLQRITFTGAGAINLTGGTVGTDNAAEIRATAGNQTINGNPNITLVGGASGGAVNLENSAAIGLEGTGTQTINAGNISITGGASGAASGAAIVTDTSGSTSNITTTGSVTLQGGAGTDAIAAIGSADGNINLTLNAGGPITLTGGSGAVGGSGWGAQAAIGTIGNFTANATVNSQAAITLTKGSTTGAEAQIGSTTGAGTVSVNAGGGGPANLTLTGGTIGSTGNVTATASNNIAVTNGLISAGGTQTVTATNDLTVTATNSTSTIQTTGTQDQTISAGTLVVQSAATSGSGRAAVITAGGSQMITAGAGGIAISGGGGVSNNSAMIQQAGLPTATQQIFVNNGGNVTLTGGSGSGQSNSAEIIAQGPSQSIDFTSGGNLVLTGGTSGQLNIARVRTTTATQAINSATGITITGGASGGGFTGVTTLGNFAQIRSAGDQSIGAGTGGITITGGAGAQTDNFAMIWQSSAGPLRQQVINVSNGGDIALTGGSSSGTGGPNGSFAFITANGGNGQTVNFFGAGVKTLTLTGGTAGQDNSAGLFSSGGQQTITGSPAITMTGGASGGSAGAPNHAIIDATGTQTITAGAMNIISSGNAATMRSPTQNITVNGNLVMTGATTQTGNSGARIGPFVDGNGNLTLTVHGDITMNPGNIANVGATLGVSGSSTVARSAPLNISADGNITMNAGSTGQTRIGQPPNFTGGGDISVTAGGSIVLAGLTTAPFSRSSVIRTLGNVTLDADAAGGSITQGPTSSIFANTLTASGHSGIALNGSNTATNFTATNSTANGVEYSQAAGSLATVTGISQSGGNVVLTADDLNISGAINAGANTVTLRPTTLARNVNIESAQTAGTLSLSPTELNFVTAKQLDVGRLDGSGTLSVTAGLAQSDINATTLRLLSGGDISITGFFGGTGSEFNNHFSALANNNLAISNTTLLFANLQNVTLAADNDASGAGNLTYSNSSGSARTIQVGTNNGNTANMTLQGRDITIGGGANGVSANLRGTGTQTIQATGSLLIQAANSALGAAQVRAEDGAQDVTAGGITLVGANAGTSNASQLDAVTQSITAGAGGITLTAGGGTGNAAQVRQTSGGGTQTITVNNGGTVALTGGSAAGGANDASINSTGTQQTLNFTAGGAINISGGSGGNNNNAQIFGVGNQTITGAPNITILGGTSGGLSTKIGINGAGTQTIDANAITVTGGAGNSTLARIAVDNGAGNQSITANAITVNGGTGTNASGTIQVDSGNQTITVNSAGAMTVTGGSAGSGNNAQVFSQTGNQTINVNGGGSVKLRGGSGAGTNNFARLGTGGGTQQIAFTGGGSIEVTGGTNGSGNAAQMDGGSQTITGSPSLTMTGGSSGGAAGNGNYAMLFTSGAQNLTLGTSQITSGNGTDTFASIQSPSQNITVNGNLLQTGSSGGIGSSNGARIGGQVDGPTNLTLTVHGNVTLNGGTQSNAAIGATSNNTTPQTTTITLNADGDITLAGAASAETRIGQPSTAVGGGNISVIAGGNIAMTGSAGSTMRTTGNLTVHADSAGKSFTQSANSVIIANTLTASGNAGVNLAGANQVGTAALSTSGGNIAYTSAQSMTVGAGGSSLTTPGGTQSVAVTTTGATSDITFTGAINSDDNYTFTSGRDIIFSPGTTVGANSATIAGAGAARFTSGIMTFNAPVTANLPVNVTGGAVNFNGATVANNGVSLAGGALQGSGNLAVNGGTFTWSDGNIGGTGVLTTATTTNNTGAVSLFRTWNNTGTVNQTGAGSVNVLTTINNVGGTWNASSAAPIALAGGNFNNAGTFISNGTQQVTSAMTNTGGVSVNSGTLTLTNFPVNAGTVNVAAATTLFANGNTGLTNTGTVMGNGTIDVGTGTLTNSGNVAPGASPGTLTVSGNYTQTAGGRLTIEVAGGNPGSYDLLNVSGLATLDGTLDIVRGDYRPAPGETYNFMTYGSRSGDFATVSTGFTPVPGTTSYGAVAGLLGPPPGTEQLIAGPSNEAVRASEQQANTANSSQQETQTQTQKEEKAAEKAEKKEVARECR